MPELVIHPRTASQLEAFVAVPSHALLLTGPVGSGKRSLAEHIAIAILELGQKSLEAHPYVKVLASADGKAIGIEQIRELEAFTSLKVPSQATWHRLILIENAHLLTTEAQNALLKTLEEPPAGTLLILTATSPQEVLPTIRSRSQIINLALPSKEQALEFFGKSGSTSQKLEQAYTMSGGLPGLLSALVKDNEHPLHAAVATARRILSASAFERQAMIDELAKQRELTLHSLEILQHMAHLSLQPSRAQTSQQSEKWQRVLEASYNAHEALSQNAQAKLVLMDMMLRI